MTPAQLCRTHPLHWRLSSRRDTPSGGGIPDEAPARLTTDPSVSRGLRSFPDRSQ